MSETLKSPTDHVMGRVKRLHFVGIGGSGMGGIAEVLLTLGYQISGSDLQENSMVKRLRERGAVISMGHNKDHVEGADAIVISSAVNEENPEVAAAHLLRIPVVRRAEMLAEIMRFRFGIAVAGTHGKTTTTSLVASILAEAGTDPTYVIGGRLNSSASHARLGSGKFLVAEADESDASFLHLQPMVSIVTNIDADHMSTYQGDFEKLKETFLEFINRLPFYGLTVVCQDDPIVASLLDRFSRPYKTYGMSEECDIRAVNIRQQGFQNFFRVTFRDGTPEFDVSLNMPGNHNVLNALAAIGVCLEVGVGQAAIQMALAGFQGIGRRLQNMGEVPTEKGTVTLIDDYGHHPRELEATLQAVRASWPDRRLVLVFQPHRYSRTHDLMDDFAAVLSTPDVLLLTEVYAASEAPIAGADGRSLARVTRARGQIDPIFVEDIEGIPDALLAVLEDGDVVLTMGAGSIGACAAGLPSVMKLKGAR